MGLTHGGYLSGKLPAGTFKSGFFLCGAVDLQHGKGGINVLDRVVVCKAGPEPF